MIALNTTATVWLYDVEVFQNYVMVGFKEYGGDRIHRFRRGSFGGLTVDTITDNRLLGFIVEENQRNSLFVGYNNFDYDDTMIFEMMSEPLEKTFQLSQNLVNGVVSPKTYKNDLEWHRVDLFKLMNGFASLKTLGVLMGHSKLQELPYPFHKTLTEDEAQEVDSYNVNDLAVTEKLLSKLAGAVNMRLALEKHYEFDQGELTSRHDASVATKIIFAEYQRVAGKKPVRPNVNEEWRAMGHTLLDSRLTFPNAPELQAVRDAMAKALFKFKLVETDAPAKDVSGISKVRKLRDDTGKLEGRTDYKGVTYSFGVGGLHSKDAPGRFIADDHFNIFSIDVASMYPTIIIETKVAPSHLDADVFLDTYRELKIRRLDAKKRAQAGDSEAKLMDVGLKIAINSVFGKLKEANSFLLDPLSSLRVILNGQLFLLKTIELLTDAGVDILSANTDGLYVRSPKDLNVAAILSDLTTVYKLVFEIDSIQRYFRTSVSDYLLNFSNGQIKAGGAFRDTYDDLTRKGDHSICTEAVVQYLLNDKPIAETISNCKDINRFAASFSVRKDEFCAIDDTDTVLPNILRWYETTSPSGTMLTKVRRSDSRDRAKFAGVVRAMLCLDLPNTFPEDVNLPFYVDAAEKRVNKVLNVNPSKLRQLRKMAEHFAANLNPYEAATLEAEDIGITVQVGDVECGGGKTYMAANLVANSSPGTIWWWSIDKIDPIAAEREAEMREAFLRNQITHDLDFMAIHSQAEGSGRMIDRIVLRQHFIESRTSSSVCDTIFVTIITHKTVLDNELEDVTGNIIIDEPISVWEQRKLKLSRSHRTAFDLIKPFRVSEKDIDTHMVNDDYQAVRLGVTAHFDNVFMFAASFDQLFIKHIWEDVYGAKFIKMDMSAAWQRRVPLADRVTVYHALSNRSVSGTYLSQHNKRNARQLEEAVTEFWKGKEFIWSTNEAYKTEMDMPPKVLNKHGDVVDSYLTPRANGINQFSNIHRAAWLGSIKLPHEATTIIRSVYGEKTKQMMLENFEHYAMYQFVNRINVRDFNSADQVEMVVADRFQAEYLARIMGLPSSCVKPLPLPQSVDLEDIAPSKGGKPQTGYSQMTATEKREYLRIKKQESRARAALKSVGANNVIRENSSCPQNSSPNAP